MRPATFGVFFLQIARGKKRFCGRLAGFGLALLLAGCGGPDPGLVQQCTDILPALEPPPAKLRLLPAEATGRDGRAVRIPFLSIDDGGKERLRFVACAFEGGGALSQERPRLIAAESDEGALAQAQLYFLQRFWINQPEALAEGRQRLVSERGESPFWLAYLIQALINAGPWTALLTLLATAYSLLYGLSHRINLAFGDLAVISSYGVVASLNAALILGSLPALAITLAIAAGLILTSLAARSLSHLVIAPLVDQPGRMLLVATIGVELAIQEGLHVIQGAGSQWIQPIFATPHILFSGDGFPVHVTRMQVIVMATALMLAILTLLAMRWSRFGLSWRALAEDRLAAALCGVSGDRVLTQTMIAAGILSGACGAIVTLAYGNAHYAFGTVLGLKAVIAAILGGIGSIEGALLGGLALGLFEGLWSAYLSIETRDIAVYAVLSLVLILRPGGIFNRAAPTPREV